MKKPAREQRRYIQLECIALAHARACAYIALPYDRAPDLFRVVVWDRLNGVHAWETLRKFVRFDIAAADREIEVRPSEPCVFDHSHYIKS